MISFIQLLQLTSLCLATQLPITSFSMDFKAGVLGQRLYSDIIELKLDFFIDLVRPGDMFWFSFNSSGDLTLPKSFDIVNGEKTVFSVQQVNSIFRATTSLSATNLNGSFTIESFPGSNLVLGGDLEVSVGDFSSSLAVDSILKPLVFLTTADNKTHLGFSIPVKPGTSPDVTVRAEDMTVRFYRDFYTSGYATAEGENFILSNIPLTHVSSSNPYVSFTLLEVPVTVVSFWALVPVELKFHKKIYCGSFSIDGIYMYSGCTALGLGGVEVPGAFGVVNFETVETVETVASVEESGATLEKGIAVETESSKQTAETSV